MKQTSRQKGANPSHKKNSAAQEDEMPSVEPYSNATQKIEVGLWVSYLQFMSSLATHHATFRKAACKRWHQHLTRAQDAWQAAQKKSREAEEERLRGWAGARSGSESQQDLSHIEVSYISSMQSAWDEFRSEAQRSEEELVKDIDSIGGQARNFLREAYESFLSSAREIFTSNSTIEPPLLIEINRALLTAASEFVALERSLPALSAPPETKKVEPAA